jgi:hypothetical protein
MRDPMSLWPILRVDVSGARVPPLALSYTHSAQYQPDQIAIAAPPRRTVIPPMPNLPKNVPMTQDSGGVAARTTVQSIPVRPIGYRRMSMGQGNRRSPVC